MKQLLTACFLLLLFISCQKGKSENPGTSESANNEVKSRTKYRIVFLTWNTKRKDNYEQSLRDFETAVNQAIAEGWQPIGGLTTASLAAAPMQAMIKTE